MNKIRRVIKVSTTYTGNKKTFGRWIKPKKYIIYAPRGDNFAVMKELRKKKSLKHKQLAWW